VRTHVESFVISKAYLILFKKKVVVKFIFYFTKNTKPLHYKTQILNTIEGNICCLLRKTYITRNYTMYVYCSLLILQEIAHSDTTVFEGVRGLYSLQGLKKQVSKYLNFANIGLPFLNGQYIICALQFLLSVKIQFVF
jgi:hypothetical protein